MDDELADLVARAEAALAPRPDWPDPRPADGLSRDAWAGRVARLRAQHDALALTGTRLFGSPIDTPPIAAATYVDIPVVGGHVAARVYMPQGPPQDYVRAFRRVGGGPRQDETAARLGAAERLARIEDAARDVIRPPKRPSSLVADPQGAGPFGAVVLFHGGAFWMGGGATGFELNDELCRVLCTGLDAVVVNVDYRLAPEHPYPTQLEDGYHSLRWTHEHAADLEVDPNRIAVLGISSGGNLAAALALLARDRDGPAIAAQLLIAPSLDCTASASSTQIDPSLYAAAIRVRSFYAADEPDWGIPYLSPVLAPDLTGLPPAVIVTGEFDPLRPNGVRYGQRLRDAGIRAANFEYPMTHTVALPKVRAASLSDLVAAAGDLIGVPVA